jgi:hypothetical protein
VKIIRVITASAPDAGEIAVTLDDSVTILYAKTWVKAVQWRTPDMTPTRYETYLQLIIEHPRAEEVDNERGYGS